jgi:hypothetical protein
MPRTTPENVRTVIDVPVAEPLALDAFISTASEIVTTVCLPSQITNPLIYTNERLELIERWLSAHCYAINRRRSAQEQVAGAAGQTLDPVPTKLHLNSTHYGQMAIALDTDGNLAAYSNALDEVRVNLPIAGPRIVWLGRTRSPVSGL